MILLNSYSLFIYFIFFYFTDNVYSYRYGDYTIETFHIESFKEVEGSTRGRRLDPLTRITLINPCPQLGKIDRRVKLMAEIIDRYLGISTKGHTQRKRNPTQSLESRPPQ